MANTHSFFTPERRKLQPESLAVPLNLLDEWSMRRVGYLPKVWGGLVFASFLDGQVTAFDEAQGKPVWSFRLPDPYRDGAPNDGDLLLSSGNLVTRSGKEILVLEASSGKLRARLPGPEFDLGSAVVEQNSLYGICVDEDEAEAPIICFSYDLESGLYLWRRKIQRFPDSLICSTRRIFLSDRPGWFTCLSSDTGEPVWSISVEKSAQFIDLEGIERKGDVTGIPVTWGNLVIVPVEGYKILAFDQEKGSLRWEQTIAIEDPHNLICSPEGQLFVLDIETFISLDSKTGHIIAQFDIGPILNPLGGPLLTRMDVSDTCLFFSIIEQGILVAMDRRSGAMLWTYACQSAIPYRNYPVAVNGRLYLLDEEHNLYVFAGR